MEQLIEFSYNHPFLVGALIVLMGLFVAFELKQAATGVSTLQLINMINNESAVIIDVRDSKDYKKGCILNSVHIPFAQIQQSMPKILHHQNSPVVVVDAIGHHSGSVSQQLKKSGFTNVFRLKGGISSWAAEHLPLSKP